MNIYSQSALSTLKESLKVNHTLNAVLAAPIRVDPEYVARVALYESLDKKFIPNAPDPVRELAAYESFRSSNNACADYSVSDSELIAEMRRLSENDFPSVPDWPHLLLRSMKVGPGASVGSRGRNSRFEKLFVNELTATNANLYAPYFGALKALGLDKAEFARIKLTQKRLTIVAGSSLSVVRKTTKVDRTICTEPSLNMIYQLALGDFITDTLSRTCGYDPALQPDRNRSLARRGSILGDVCTIDLHAASDTISLSLCQAVLPSELYAAIEDCRCTHTLLKDELIPLKMVSSMGNGFTFPLETYIFSLCLRALENKRAVRFDRISSPYGVFGDDIIAPNGRYNQVVRALESLGFIVNASKSFHTGFFRESCGADFYDGEDVRGVYCKRLDCLADCFSLANRLNRWSAIHKIVLPVHSICPPHWASFSIPSDLSDNAGIKTPYPAACNIRTVGDKAATLTPSGSNDGQPSRHRQNIVYQYKFLSAKKPTFKVLFDDVLRPSHFNEEGFIQDILWKMSARTVASRTTSRDFVVSKRRVSHLDRRADELVFVKKSGTSPFWCRTIDNVLPRGGVNTWAVLFIENMKLNRS